MKITSGRCCESGSRWPVRRSRRHRLRASCSSSSLARKARADLESSTTRARFAVMPPSRRPLLDVVRCSVARRSSRRRRSRGQAAHPRQRAIEPGHAPRHFADDHCAAPSCRTLLAHDARARSDPPARARPRRRNPLSDSSTTQAPLPGVSTERVPRHAVETTGRACAMASSSTRPWVSVRDANTKTSAAA